MVLEHIAIPPERSCKWDILGMRQGTVEGTVEPAEKVLIYEGVFVQYLQNNGEMIEFWFVKEQGEEETNADNLVKKFELFGDDPKSLYMLDSELGGRVYSAPSLVL